MTIVVFITVLEKSVFNLFHIYFFSFTIMSFLSRQYWSQTHSWWKSRENIRFAVADYFQNSGTFFNLFLILYSMIYIWGSFKCSMTFEEGKKIFLFFFSDIKAHKSRFTQKRKCIFESKFKIESWFCSIQCFKKTWMLSRWL